VPALIAYVLLCMFVAYYVTGLHLVVDLLFYLLAGLIWIFPASAIVKWLAHFEAK